LDLFTYLLHIRHGWQIANRKGIAAHTDSTGEVEELEELDDVDVDVDADVGVHLAVGWILCAYQRPLAVASFRCTGRYFSAYF